MAGRAAVSRQSAWVAPKVARGLRTAKVKPGFFPLRMRNCLHFCEVQGWPPFLDFTVFLYRGSMIPASARRLESAENPSRSPNGILVEVRLQVII